jgi:predicted phosphodiesterase
MRVLIISDIHANLPALEAVLADAEGYEATWCLGDLVGYGPDPNECVARIKNLPRLLCTVGNHDAAALKQIDIDTFNPEARSAIMWTRQALSDETKIFLTNLPEKIVVDQVTLTHGSPRHPVWEYLLDTRTATINFDYFETLLCFVGHTHLPVIYSLPENDFLAHLEIPEHNRPIPISTRAIINPGSVGQPRDRDPRAAYAIYDTEAKTWNCRRVTYDILSVQSRMELVGLPERHIQRLSTGW